MKSNQLLQVKLGNHVQLVELKTHLGHLNSLWDYGNGLRAAKSLPPLEMKDWLRSKQTIELIGSLAKKHNGGISPSMIDECVYDEKGRAKLSSIPNNPYLVTKRGKGGGTWANLYLLLDAAAWLDSDFKLDVYECFISNRILQWRNDSGDEFIALNAAIDAYLPERADKDNTGVYIQVATRLKIKILGSKDAEWNKASAAQLEYRTDLERQLIKLLKLGLVTSFDHLKDLIDRM